MLRSSRISVVRPPQGATARSGKRRAFRQRDKLGRETAGGMTRWTHAEDQSLHELWSQAPMTKIMRALPGRRYSQLAQRAMAISAGSRAQYRWPSTEVWVETVRQESERVGAPFPRSLASIRGRCALARWRAFERLSREYSLAGIGRVSGFDHTSVIHGLRRLAELRAAKQGRAQA